MIEFMENGEGQYKAHISKHEEDFIRKSLLQDGFKDEIDFHIAICYGFNEIIFYNKKCKSAYKGICK